MYNSATQAQEATITIRPARAGDAGALERLAQLEGADLPEGELLVAELGDEVRAAVSIATGEGIANPFRPSAELVRLLSERAAQLRGGRRPGMLARLRRGRRRASFAPQPAGTLRALD